MILRHFFMAVYRMILKISAETRILPPKNAFFATQKVAFLPPPPTLLYSWPASADTPASILLTPAPFWHSNGE
jgi:hypothetical protein